MSNYVRPDTLSRVPITGGELILSPGYDVLHHFEPLGAFMLKYWDTDKNNMSNVLLRGASALYLMVNCGLTVVERPFILASEHESLVQWQSDSITDADFGL